MRHFILLVSFLVACSASAQAQSEHWVVTWGTATTLALDPALDWIRPMRQEINAWIRSSGKYDAVVDFDAVTRDPAQPTHMRAAHDSGDHIHPNDAGNKAMAEAIDLRVFTITP